MSTAIGAITDRRGKITYVNDKVCGHFEVFAGRMIGQDHEVITRPTPEERHAGPWQTIGEGRCVEGEIKTRRRTFLLRATPRSCLPGDDRKKPTYIPFAPIITMRKKAETRAQRAAHAQVCRQSRADRHGTQHDFGKGRRTRGVMFPYSITRHAPAMLTLDAGLPRKPPG